MTRPVAELGTLEREIHVAATPEVVWEVLTRPEHLSAWWPDDADLGSAEPGATGRLVFGSGPDAVVEQLTVVEAVRPHVFAFRWTHPAGTAATPGNSLLVTFRLAAEGTGTRLHLTETGFRDQGWEVAVLAERYADHERGWDHFLPRLVAHGAALGRAR